MKVYVLMFGFEFDGIEDVELFTSLEAAKYKGEKLVKKDEDGFGEYDFYYIKEKEVK